MEFKWHRPNSSVKWGVVLWPRRRERRFIDQMAPTRPQTNSACLILFYILFRGTQAGASDKFDYGWQSIITGRWKRLIPPNTFLFPIFVKGLFFEWSRNKETIVNVYRRKLSNDFHILKGGVAIEHFPIYRTTEMCTHFLLPISLSFPSSTSSSSLFPPIRRRKTQRFLAIYCTYTLPPFSIKKFFRSLPRFSVPW